MIFDDIKDHSIILMKVLVLKVSDKVIIMIIILIKLLINITETVFNPHKPKPNSAV